MKLTKIVATIGPSSESEDKIKALIQEGVNVFRLNFKHNTIEWHNQLAKRINTIAKNYEQPVGILLDLQGPEIRMRLLSADTIQVSKQRNLVFQKDFTISHPEIFDHLMDGQHIVVDDGQFIFILKRKNNSIELIPDSDGVLKNHKSMNIPGADFPLPALTERDKEGVRLVKENNIDFVALSFVRADDDINNLRKVMGEVGARARIIAKIETRKALDNLDSIIETADSIMVARGDLGVEMPLEKVPYYQKVIIHKSFEKGKPVITATQMLESMTDHPYPTRAEVSDIANAAFDLTDAVMLSGETATGRYPVEAVRLMARTVTYNEDVPITDIRLQHLFELKKQEALICDAAYNIYHKSENEEPIKAFIVLTHSGNTAQMISRYRPQVPIYAFVPNREVADSLSLNFGVYPFLSPVTGKDNTRVGKKCLVELINFLKTKKYLQDGERIIALHGDFWGVVGGASTIRMMKA